MTNCYGTSLIPWCGDQGYTGGLPDVLARAAEPGWGDEHEHGEPRGPAPRRPAVPHWVAARRPAPARPGPRGGRSRRGPGPLPRGGRDDHPPRLRGPDDRRRLGYPALPGRAAADPGRRQRPVHRRFALRVPAVPVPVAVAVTGAGQDRPVRPGGHRLAGEPAGPGGPAAGTRGRPSAPAGPGATVGTTGRDTRRPAGWSCAHPSRDTPSDRTGGGRALAGRAP